MSTTLPVTVITGTSSENGASVLRQLMQTAQEDRLIAIVPKRGKRKNSKSASTVQTSPQLVRLGEGCGCCTVRGDLLSKVRRIATDQSADHILIHANQTSDLVPLAKTFTVPDKDGYILSELASLQSLTVVIDINTFLRDLHGTEARAVIERIELASVIIGIGASGIPTLEANVLRALNPTARVVTNEDASFSLNSLSTETPFNLSEAQRRASLEDILENTAPQEQSVSRIRYQARRPFHPQRFRTALNGSLGNVLRAHGSFWVASRPNDVGLLDIAGPSLATKAGGTWWASVPPSQHPTHPAFVQHKQTDWDSVFGDRQQQLAFVGIELDEANIKATLDACLLSVDELQAYDKWKHWNGAATH